MLKIKLSAVLVFALISAGTVSAQSSSPAQKPTTANPTSPDPASAGGGSSVPTNGSSDPYEQPSRILGIIPNFRAVSADKTLPPLSVGGKFWLATKSNFDYSSVITVGIESGISQATGSNNREFGQGAAGFGRRYWHSYADSVISNYLTTGILPSITHEDPRYYTLGRGTVLHRTGYALSRLFLTKNDAGRWTANFSEIPGNGIAAGISNAYWPASRRGWVNTYQRWTYQITVDAVGNILKEFWPDISHKFFGTQKNGALQGRNNP